MFFIWAVNECNAPVNRSNYSEILFIVFINVSNMSTVNFGMSWWWYFHGQFELHLISRWLYVAVYSHDVSALVMTQNIITNQKHLEKKHFVCIYYSMWIKLIEENQYPLLSDSSPTDCLSPKAFLVQFVVLFLNSTHSIMNTSIYLPAIKNDCSVFFVSISFRSAARCTRW